MKTTQKFFCCITSIIILCCLPSIVFAQWLNISNISTARLSSVKFFDVNTGVTAGNNGIWRTTNGGFNWTQVLNSSKLNSIAFYNQNEGMAVGDSGKIFKTTDNGVTWQQLSSGTVLNLNSIAVAPPGKDDNGKLVTYFAYIVGQNGIFMRSFNSGASWSIGSVFTQDIYYLFLLPTGTGFAVGASNCEYFTTTANGGTNWLAILNTTNGGYHLYSGAYAGQNICLAVGSSGRLRRTTNWGLSWTLPISNTTYDLYAITFADANTGWLCGLNGFIERSTNGGFNWVQQFAPNFNHLRCIYFINNLTGWIVGDNGVVLRTDNGGITGIQNKNTEVPGEFKLYQNYPNPFNPTTKIRFDIPLKSDIKIIVYDLRGRKIFSLLNDKLEAGSYEITWDASNYSSGIYFYQLISNNFSITKKLILIK
jgi:photosystem II stability/assembly factor-like uncharacterized protein